jgi:hypothetical protein
VSDISAKSAKQRSAKQKLKPAKSKPETSKAESIALADLPPEKLAAFVQRHEQERDARIEAKVQAGEAVRIRVIRMEDEDEKSAQERASQYTPLDGKVPVFDIVRIITGVERDPGEVKPEANFDFDLSANAEESYRPRVRVGEIGLGIHFRVARGSGVHYRLMPPNSRGLRMTEERQAQVLSLWAALVSVVALYFLTGSYWKAALIGVFVGISSVLGYGKQWVLKGSFAIAIFAIAVALGLPPPDRWLQLARELGEAIVALKTSG